MRKKYIALIGLAALVAWPAVNIYAAFRPMSQAYTELAIGKQEVHIVGDGAAYFSEKLQEFSDTHGWDLVVYGPDDENDANTAIVVLYSFDRINEKLAEDTQLCGDLCKPDSPGEVYAAGVSELGLLGRIWKIAYVQLLPFAVDGTVDGERFVCLMQLMAQEAKILLPTPKPGDDFEYCKKLIYERGGTTYTRETSFKLFSLGFRFGL